MIDYEKLKWVHELLSKIPKIQFCHFISEGRHTYSISFYDFCMSERDFKDIDNLIEFLERETLKTVSPQC